MSATDYKLLERYMESELSKLQKNTEEIKKYTENENYGLEAIKKSINDNKGGILSEIELLKKKHKLVRINSESYHEPPNDTATVFYVEEGISGIIKLLSIKFIAITTASDTVQDMPFVLRDLNDNDLFNFYVHQPRHTGASGTYNTTVILDLIPVNLINSFKLYDNNNNGTQREVYVFNNSNVVSCGAYSSTCNVHVVIPQKGIAFDNGFKLSTWIQYGYNSNVYADCKLIYDKYK